MKIELDYYTERFPARMTRKALSVVGDFIDRLGNDEVTVRGSGQELTIEWTDFGGVRMCEQTTWRADEWRDARTFVVDAEPPCEFRVVGCDGSMCDGCRDDDDTGECECGCQLDAAR